MSAIDVLKKRKIVIVALVAYVIVFFYDQSKFTIALGGFWMYLKEMIEILPAIFIITGLIDVWVSRDTILKFFGSGAGIKGKMVSVLVGSVSAGPIYAAFPITHSLLKKGASLSNVVVMLSAWAVIKIPMLIVESKFLGISFMGARYVLTLPGILLIGVITDRFVDRKEVLAIVEKKDSAIESKLLELLPGYNCGACGYKSCAGYAKMLATKDVKIDACKPGGDKLVNLIKEVRGK
ncbi:MAG: Fe-S cluster protein [Thermoplasmata archaeon]|nr:MAG: Fe-S cluster protein [Thermoplasmata archaeon]